MAHYPRFHHHYVDNDAARLAVISGASGAMRYLKRHQETSLHFLRDYFAEVDDDGNKTRSVERIDAKENRADLFTKHLPRPIFL